MDWSVTGNLICFIGAGDSTKSTILDAIEYALLPRWNVSFDDTDFYNLDVTNDILLEFDHAIILDADSFDRKNLYVALTRASKTVTIISNSSVLLRNNAFKSSPV